jgi:hypothetical protein
MSRAMREASEMRQNRYRRLGSAALLAVAGLVVLLAALPWADWLGFARESETMEYVATVIEWLLWGGSIALLSLVVAALAGGRVDSRWDRFADRLQRIPGWIYAASLALGLVATALFLSNVVFTRNPHLIDTIAQLFQARIFAGGALTAPAPDDLEFFIAQHIVVRDGQWFSQYPPGHPALLALGLLAGLPWLINPLFAAATLVLVYLIGRRLAGEDTGRLAAGLYLISPFVLFMSASYMNHVTTAFFLALALYAALRAAEPASGFMWPATMGLALAAGATIRPLEAGAWAAVLGLWLLARRGWWRAFTAGAACTIGMIPLLTYNTLTTGHPLRFGYTLLWGEGHGLGFHTDPWGLPFTPLEAIANTALDFQRLDMVLLSWPVPSLLFLVAALVLAAVRPGRRTGIGLLAALFLAAPTAYFFYWHRDDFLGPRFLHASLVPAILLSAMGIVALDRSLGRWRSALRVAIPLSVLFFLTLKLPAQAGLLSGRWLEMKLHPEREVAELGSDDALVFVKAGWGSRLVARLAAWRVPAPLIEKTFRLVDGCRIQQALDEADSLATVSDRDEVAAHLRARLEADLHLAPPAVRDRLPDPSVRVDTTRALTPACLLEVQRDESGYTVYETLAWRNDPWLREGILYARDFGPERNLRLLRRYPRRDVFLYTRTSQGFGSAPQLLRIRIDNRAPPVPETAGSSTGGGE